MPSPEAFAASHPRRKHTPIRWTGPSAATAAPPPAARPEPPPLKRKRADAESTRVAEPREPSFSALNRRGEEALRDFRSFDAHDAFLRALSGARAAGDERGIAKAYLGLAKTAPLPKARAAYAEAVLAYPNAFGAQHSAAHAILGRFARTDGRLAEAAEHLEAARDRAATPAVFVGLSAEAAAAREASDFADLLHGVAFGVR